MSVNDPIEIKYDEKRDFFWLKQGSETFYNEDRCMIVFLSEEDAIEWCEKEKGVAPIAIFEQSELL